MNHSSSASVSTFATTLAVALPLFAVTACSSSSSDSQPGPAPTMHTGVLIVGSLADDATAQSQHDALAHGGQSAASQAGDIGHEVFLGTTLLGTTKNEFLALDRWIAGANVDGFYAQPDFAKGFAAIFSAPPFRSAYVVQSTWRTWGSLEGTDPSKPRYWVVLRGTMASSDPAKNQATHDAIAAGAQEQAQQAGDLGHTAFVGRDDPTQLLAIDTWQDTTHLEAFYGNAGFQKAFTTFLTAPPTIGVYASTDWYQW
jgi:quinol monooxygenase YgiN